MNDLLKQNGFLQLFPCLQHFRKEISETELIQVNTCYLPKRNDIIEDETGRAIYIKVTKINLPSSESKVFHKPENALSYINQ